MYKIEKSKEIDKELGILWEDIKIYDENNNYIIFRKKEYGTRSGKWEAHEGKIIDTKFYDNEKTGFTKVGKGKVKREVEEKRVEMFDWIFEKIEEIRKNYL